jgi:hypothetical protein
MGRPLDAPPARSIRESGGTVMTMGAVTNGQYLKRNGSTVDSGAGGGGGSAFSGARASKSGGSTQTIPDSAWTEITWESEPVDTDAYIDLGTYNKRVTIPSGKAGTVTVVLCLAPSAVNTTGVRAVRVAWRNSSDVVQAYICNNQMPALTGIGNSMNAIAPMIAVAVGDYFIAEMYQNSGTTVDIAANDSSSLSVQYLSA